MEIQVALDRIPLEQAVRVAADIADHVDWIEVGTSMIKQFGRAGLEEYLPITVDEDPVVGKLAGPS